MNSKIKNKSFNGFELKDKFEKFNIFFGVNGSGKSALAEWLKEFYSESSQLFDSQYVIKNLKLSETDEINGVKVSIGETQVNNDISKEMLEIANASISTNIDLKRDKLETLKTSLTTLIETYLKNVKHKFKGIDIRQKPNIASNPLKVKNSWINEYRKYTENNEDIEEINNVSIHNLTLKIERAEKKLRDLKNTTIDLDENRINNIRNILKKKIYKPNFEITKNILDWLDDGILIHSDSLIDHNKDTSNLKGHDIIECKFCGNQFKIANVIQKVLEVKNEEYSSMITEFDKFEKVLKSLINLSILDDENKKKVNNAITNILNQINQKKDEPEKALLLIDDDIQTVYSLVNFQKKEIETTKSLISNINKKLHNLEDLAKYIMGKYIFESEEILSLENKIFALENSISRDEDAKADNIQQIDYYNEQLSEYSDFLRLANYELQYLGLNFKLTTLKSGAGYGLIHINQKIRLSVDDLSEGELRILAFIHFYYSLFENYNAQYYKFKPVINQIIIDDPVTSLDMENRIMVIQRINSLMDKTKNTPINVFVFTHSSYDYHNFAYNIKTKKSYWRIFKDEFGYSSIEKVDNNKLKNYSDYYKNYFLEISNFAILGKTKLKNIQNVYVYANKMRMIIESHARSNYYIGEVTERNIEKIKKYYNVKDVELPRILNSINLINSLSHGKSYYDEIVNEVSIRELQKSVRHLIKLMFDLDSNHVETMSDNNINSKVIEKWNI